jgi:hypothetical protein
VATAPATAKIVFAISREILVTWRLHYTDRWRLQAAPHQSF